jgi:gliding motility-associated-like protein
VNPAPTAAASSNGPVCTGETLELTSAGAAGTPSYTYNWSGPGGFISPEQNPTRLDASIAMGGTYTVTVTDSNGCTGTATTVVTVHPAPAIAAMSNSPVCEGDTIELISNPTNGTGPYTINWTGPNGFVSTDQNPNISNATEVMSGAYIVRVSDVNGCFDSMIVTVLVAPVSANGLVPAMACADGALSLEALNLNPGDAVLWSSEPATLEIDEPTAPSTTASGPGGQYTISLQVTNLAGCVADTSFTVNIITVNVDVEVTGKDTICSGESTPLLATASGTATEYTYSWSPAGSLDNSNIPNPIASPDGQETYTVTVTGDNLCTATGSVTVYFMETQCRDPYIFVPKAFTPNADNNNDRFRVRGTNITELLFIVYDRWGEEVYRTEDPDHAGWDGTYRGEPSTPDSYGWYLRVRCGNGQIFENKGNVTLFK